MAPFDEVEVLWNEYLNLPLPAGLAGEEIAGVELVLLDDGIAGCVATWLGNHGRLDDQRKAISRNASTTSTRFFHFFRKKVRASTSRGCADSLS